MAGRQRTFELVPTSLVKFNGRKPPMTSKAAKKAHQLATRGPKVSRADQRRRDAEELARQKKEYERENASAKAKAAREKKAARELAKRELRKKNGIPEPNKFVRASQPTISMFVKSGKKQTWLEMDKTEESDIIPVSDNAEQGAEFEGPPTKKAKAGDESDDEYGGFPSFSQSDLGAVLEEVESSAQSESIQNERIECGVTATPESKEPPNIATIEPSKITTEEPPTNPIKDLPDTVAEESQKCATTEPPTMSANGLPRPPLKQPPKHASRQPSRIEVKELTKISATRGSSNDFPFKYLDNIDDMAATQLVMEATDAATRLRRQSEPAMVKNQPGSLPLKSITTPKPVLAMPQTKLKRRSPRAAKTSRPALQERSINMPPPLLLPAKEERSISFASSPPHPPPQVIPKTPTLSPSATQAFLENHLDDFFPSHSKEIQEQLDDVDDLPSNSQIIGELEPNLLPNAPQEYYFADLICTQDFVLSSQDILEITTPWPPPSKPKKEERSTSTPTPLPTKTTRQPRRRFFEEKEEDLVHAAIQESKMLANQREQMIEKSTGRLTKINVPVALNDRNELSGREKRDFKRTQSNATDYGDDEFYGCEEELLALC